MKHSRKAMIAMSALMVFGTVLSASAETPTYSLAKDPIVSYVSAARAAYPSDPNYTISVVDDYTVSSSDKTDYPNAVTLSWDALGTSGTYTLTIHDETDPTDADVVITGIDGTTYDVYNLRTDTEYTWKVSRGGEESDESAFVTADTPRFIYVPNIRNVRDLGGWNGIKQGLAYRGGRLNNGETFTAEGKKVLSTDLAIKSDLDFRTDSEIGGITSSPIGSGTAWFNYHAGSSGSLFSSSKKEAYRDSFNVFAEKKNYPIYFHCVGGADRTAAVAMIVEALCGVSETDMAIDYELTSFSKWSARHRYDDPASEYNTTYATAYKKLAALDGSTLPEKAENYMLSLGMTRSAVSNIRSILAGNGISFAFTGDAAYDTESYDCELLDLGDHTVESVTLGGSDVPFTLHGSTLTMTLTEAGTGVITFDDGETLSFDAVEAVRAFKVSVPETVEAGYITIGCDDETAKAAVIAGISMKKAGAAVTPTVVSYGNTVAIPVASLDSDSAYTLYINAEGSAPYSTAFTTGTVDDSLFALAPAATNCNKAAGVKCNPTYADPSVKGVFTLSDNVTSADTVIHSDGYLIIGADETANSVTVTLSSLYEPDKKISKTITVNDTVNTTTGTRANPNLITNEADFLAFTEAVIGGTTYNGKYFKQTADIDMTGVEGYNGMSSDKNFSGYYDGNGHTITVDISSDNDHCVFGCVSASGTVVNTGFLGSIYSSGPYGAAGICRKNQGKVVNCYSKVKVTGKTPAALCRSCYAKMYNCYAYNTEATFSYNPLLIQNDGVAWNVLYYSSSENRDNTDTVPLNAASLDGTYAAARLNDGIETAAELAGIPASALKTWYGEVTGGPVMIEPQAKVLSVSVSGKVTQIVRGCAAPFTVAVTAQAGASETVVWTVEGASSAATAINQNGELTVGADETASTLTVRATSAYDESVSGTIEVTLIDITEAAEGSRFNPYLIESEADFMALTADLLDGKSKSGKYYRQTVDLDMTKVEGYNGIPESKYFKGVYDGCGHTITYAIETDAQETVFGYMSGTVMNLGFCGTLTSTGTATDIYLGAMARSVQASGFVINCYSTVSINSTGRAVGVAGSVYGTASNCFIAGSIVGAKGKNAFYSATKETTLFEHCYYLTSCGASCSKEGTAAIDAIMYPDSAVTTMNEGRAAAAARAGVTTNEIALWCVENGVIGQKMAGEPEEEEIPAVISISVSGASSVTKGSSSTFTATVTVQSDADDTVVWSVEGATSAATFIDENGSLTVGLLETAATLTVKATSTFDDTVTGTIAVTVADITDAAEGTRFNPILIQSEADFMALTNDLLAGKKKTGKYYRQTVDLDMTKVAEYNGIPYTAYFAGIYDGYGHTITYAIETEAEESVFGHCTGTVMNLGFCGTLTSTGTATDIYLGAVARSVTATGRIINCYTTVSINSTGRADGIAGSVYGTVSNTFIAGSITGEKGKKAFCSATKDTTVFEHSYYLTSCGATATNAGTAALDAAMYPGSAVTTMNEGRAAAAAMAGVTMDEIAFWCVENGVIGQIMPGQSGDAEGPTMLKLTSIRITGTPGLRFAAYVTDEQREASSSYGFLVARENDDLKTDPTHLVFNDANSTAGTNSFGITYTSGEAYNKANGIDKTYAEDGTAFGLSDVEATFFTGVMQGIPKAFYAENLIARPYMVVDGVTLYGETYSKSLYDNACAIRDGGYEGLDDDGIAYIDSIIGAVDD